MFKVKVFFDPDRAGNLPAAPVYAADFPTVPQIGYELLVPGQAQPKPVWRVILYPKPDPMGAVASVICSN